MTYIFRLKYKKLRGGNEHNKLKCLKHLHGFIKKYKIGLCLNQHSKYLYSNVFKFIQICILKIRKKICVFEKQNTKMQSKASHTFRSLILKLVDKKGAIRYVILILHDPKYRKYLLNLIP